MARFIVLPGLRCWRPANRLYNNREDARPGMPLSRWLARFRQKRDGKDDYIEGEGERVVHDARSEKTEFFVRAWIRNGQDEVRGHYISYDALSEKYLVTNNSGATKSATGETQARVRAIIQPKSKTAPAADNKDEALSLKPSPSTNPER